MIKSLRQKILDFFLTNRFFRVINVFLFHYLRSWLIKIFLSLLTLTILIAIILKLFQPQILDKIYSKSAAYFFYHLNLSANNFDKINVAGNKRTNKEEVVAIVNSAKRTFPREVDFKYSASIQNLIDDIRSNLHWVKDVTVSRSLPNVLNITLVEYEPFAIWQNGDKKYIIDRDGNTIPFEKLEELEKMVILSGIGANLNARSLFNIFAINPDFSQKVYSATWVGNRRWDIRLESGLLIKLPEQNIASAWHNLIKIYNMPGAIIKLKMIDLRIENRIYLEYEDSTMKEIKNI